MWYIETVITLIRSLVLLLWLLFLNLLKVRTFTFLCKELLDTNLFVNLYTHWTENEVDSNIFRCPLTVKMGLFEIDVFTCFRSEVDSRSIVPFSLRFVVSPFKEVSLSCVCDKVETVWSFSLPWRYFVYCSFTDLQMVLDFPTRKTGLYWSDMSSREKITENVSWLLFYLFLSFFCLSWTPSLCGVSKIKEIRTLKWNGVEGCFWSVSEWQRPFPHLRFSVTMTSSGSFREGRTRGRTQDLTCSV